MIDFLKEAEVIKEELINIRRDIHMHPELGFEEVRTSKIIKDFLWYEGIEYFVSGKTGICAIIKGEAGEGKTLGIRADIDGLPVIDKKDCYYKSKNPGKMHACGHDAHTTILLGVARILNKYKSDFKGNIKLFFEPAEETTGGAKLMIEEGVLDNPYVEGVIGLHVSEDVDCGKISIRKRMVNAASNPFTITIKGKGAHGASPNHSIDPIVIASKIVLALQSIVSREVSPFHPMVLTIGSIHGGTVSNVIPDEVSLSGIIRTITSEDREYVVKRVKEIVEGICKSFRAQAEVNIYEGYPCLYNNEDLTDRLIDVAGDLIGEGNIIIKENPSLGVESFAYFANERPSVFYYLGSRNIIKGTDKPAHGNYFDIDEDCLEIGVALQSAFIYDYLTRE